ncbi:MAG: MBL fold metallo-hydrolase [Christensenellales bacterium]|jgi:L-ascorbate metabolism protein UlaG (beta-lactamase superfamily)
MKIRYFGHSCFLLTSDSNVSLLTDPFDDTVGYSLPRVKADVVTSSHDHFDHNHFPAVLGDFEKVTAAGKHVSAGISIEGFDTFHDEKKGGLRGENIIFVIEMDGMRVCHCGDLGHLPDAHTLERMGAVDVLMVPVGGTFTLNAQEAKTLSELLKPNMIIPMHYRTPATDMGIAGVDDFLKQMDKPVLKTGNIFEPKANDAGKVIVMQYE